MNKTIILPLIIALFSFDLLASATDYDYLKCKKLAVSFLKACLNTEGTFTNQKCWDNSEHEYKQCLTQIKNIYSKDKEYIKARLEAEQKALKAKKTQEKKPPKTR